MSARTQSGITELTFRGDPCERGLLRGAFIRSTFRPPPPPPLPARFVQACFDAACELHPPAGPEFEGIVRGGRFERDAMMAYCFARLEAQACGCTMVGLAPPRRAGRAGALAGRN